MKNKKNAFYEMNGNASFENSDMLTPLEDTVPNRLIKKPNS